MSSLVAAAAALSLLQSAPMTDAGREIAAQEARKLDTCRALIETAPDEAYEMGLVWLGKGNRPPARHCTALALIALEHYEDGAARLEELANASDAGGVEARALYLAQAGNAWLAAGLPEAALTTLENANRISPGDAELMIDLASARLALGQWRQASGILGRALEIAPGHPEALELRARALIQMGPSVERRRALGEGVWHAIDRQLPAFDVDCHGFAIGDAPFKDHPCERVLDFLLDHPLERARAIDRIITAIGQPASRILGQFHAELAVGQQLVEPLHLDIDNMVDLLAPQSVEEHRLVDPVDEFGPEMPANGVHDRLTRGLADLAGLAGR